MRRLPSRYAQIRILDVPKPGLGFSGETVAAPELVMKRSSLFVALLATSAMAEAKSISQISFSGLGIVTASDGHPSGPGRGQWNRIDGHITFYQPNCLAADVDGTIDLGDHHDRLCDNSWRAEDRFVLSSISIDSQYSRGLLTFDHGTLVGVEFRGENGPSYLGFDTTRFSGGWSYFPAYDYSYSGTWTMSKVSIAYDGEPLPGTVPEPASWALLVNGFGIVGAGMRRRRRISGTA
jgi:hypothetical protein